MNRKDKDEARAMIILIAIGFATLIGLILADPMAHIAHYMLENGG